MCPLPGLEARNLKSTCPRGWLLVEAHRETLFEAPFPLRAAAGEAGRPWAGHTSPVAVPSSSPGLLLRPGVGLRVSSPLYGQHRIGLGGGCLTARAKTLFPHEAPSQAPGGGQMFAQHNRHLRSRASEVLVRRRRLRPGAFPAARVPAGRSHTPGAAQRAPSPPVPGAAGWTRGAGGGGSVRGVARGLGRGAQAPAREQRTQHSVSAPGEGVRGRRKRPPAFPVGGLPCPLGTPVSAQAAAHCPPPPRDPALRGAAPASRGWQGPPCGEGSALRERARESSAKVGSARPEPEGG